jgi:hypothetical protein
MDLPDDDSLRWIVSRYAGLRARHSAAIGDPDTLQPTPAYFPDEFRLDAPSVGRLAQRMFHYAPISDSLSIELAFLDPEEGPRAGGCGSGACEAGAPRAIRAGVDEKADGYRLSIDTSDVPNPEVLTATLARATGALVLYEADEPVDAATSELAAVACGFGVLLANGAAVWAKACGGLRMTRATALSVEETTLALALFASLHRKKPSEVRARLGSTQREAFGAACEWVDSNGALLESLRERPAVLETGLFDVDPVRSPLSRWFQRIKHAKQERELRNVAARPAAILTDERRRRLEEAKALVDEVMGS